MSAGIIAASYVDASATPYRDEVLADNPWAYWRMRDVAGPLQDETANDRDAVQVNVYEPIWDQVGPKGRAVNYLAGDYYTWSSATHNASTFAHEFWFKVPAIGDIALVGNILSISNATGDKGVWLQSNGKIRFHCYNGAAKNLDSTTTFVANTWYHIVCSVGPSGQMIIVNGVLDAIDATVTSSYTGVSNHVAQHVCTNGGGFIVGATVRLAEVAAYVGSELSVTRALAHYNAPGTPNVEPFKEAAVINAAPKIAEDMPIGAKMYLFVWEYTRLQGLDATAPTVSGWTFINKGNSGTGDGGGIRMSAFERTCQAGDAGSTVSISYQGGVAALTSHSCVVGFNVELAHDTVTVHLPGATSTPVTTTVAGEKILYMVGAYRSNGGAYLDVNDPAGGIVTRIVESTGDTHGTLHIAVETQAVAGASTVRTFTEVNGVGGSEMGVLAIPIKP